MKTVLSHANLIDCVEPPVISSSPVTQSSGSLMRFEFSSGILSGFIFSVTDVPLLFSSDEDARRTAAVPAPACGTSGNRAARLVLMLSGAFFYRKAGRP